MNYISIICAKTSYKTWCLFFLCFRSCFMPKHELMTPVCFKRIHRRIHFIWLSNVFSQNILINSVSLFLMLFSTFNSEPLFIACNAPFLCYPLLTHRFALIQQFCHNMLFHGQTRHIHNITWGVIRIHLPLGVGLPDGEECHVEGEIQVRKYSHWYFRLMAFQNLFHISV